MNNNGFTIMDLAQYASSVARELDRKITIQLLSIPIILAFIEYWAFSSDIFARFPSLHNQYPAKIASLLAVIYWATLCLLGYACIPGLMIKYILRERISGYGLGASGFASNLRMCAILFIVVLPFVVFASFFPSFQKTYPFYDPVIGGWLLFGIYEFFRILQFFGLEFFFRGYGLFGLERKFGNYSILIMTIPYCMGHFHKPISEALSSIVAGIVLGSLALKTRSIWCGLLLHVFVALSMDFFALLQKGAIL